MALVERVEISDFLDDAMMEYSAYVILFRALPSLTDGLKISYRRILYCMLKNSVTKLTKSGTVEGDVFKYHPHGGAYPTMVTMTQKDTNIIPLLDGKGNFAYHTSRDMQPAGQRYSEVKLSKYALDMMKSLDKNIVDMKPTYDGSAMEPKELPVKFPQILTLAQQGLAVGMACNFASFNLKEVCQAVIDFISDGTKTILYPDLATGGYLIKDEEAIKNINFNGKGTFTLRAKYVVEDNYILIKEIPYTTTREEIIEKIVDLVKAGKIKEIIDIKDTTDIKGMEIEITTRKNTNHDELMQRLYKLTPLESTFPVNMNVLHNNNPKLMGVWDIIPEWIEWRKGCIKRVLLSEADELERKLQFLLGLKKCLLNLDEVVRIIRFEKENDILPKLKKTFDLSDEQAEGVASMKLRNINTASVERQVKDIEKVERQITLYRKMASSDKELLNGVIKGLKETMDAYGQQRRTIIIDKPIEETIKQEKVVENYNCWVSITKEGYAKKSKLSDENGKRKDDDIVLDIKQTTNLSNILLITSKCNYYTVKVDDLDMVSTTVLGEYLPNTLKFAKDEEIIFAKILENYEGYLLLSYSNGNINKVPLESYKSSRTKGTNAYYDKARLIDIKYITDDINIMFIATNGKAVINNTSRFKPKATKNALGINLQKLKEGEETIRTIDCTNVDKDIVDYYTCKNAGTGNLLKKQHKF